MLVYQSECNYHCVCLRIFIVLNKLSSGKEGWKRAYFWSNYVLLPVLLLVLLAVLLMVLLLVLFSPLTLTRWIVGYLQYLECWASTSSWKTRISNYSNCYLWETLESQLKICKSEYVQIVDPGISSICCTCMQISRVHLKSTLKWSINALF